MKKILTTLATFVATLALIAITTVQASAQNYQVLNQFSQFDGNGATSIRGELWWYSDGLASADINGKRIRVEGWLEDNCPGDGWGGRVRVTATNLTDSKTFYQDTVGTCGSANAVYVDRILNPDGDSMVRYVDITVLEIKDGLQRDQVTKRYYNPNL